MPGDDLRYDDQTGVINAGLATIGSSIPWLKKRLSDLSCYVHPASLLATSFDAIADMQAKVASDGRYSFKNAEEAQQWYLRASGTDFLSKVLHRGSNAGLAGFEPLFRNLPGGDPILTGHDRNLARELVLASLIATFATDVTKAEPDILCHYKGERIGVAAKVLYSAARETHLDRIKHGARQLERSPADHGFVVINLVQLFPHFRCSRTSPNPTYARTRKPWR
jgi:hypothetical protein